MKQAATGLPALLTWLTVRRTRIASAQLGAQYPSMLVTFYKADVSSLRKRCSCGGSMRLVGIEPDLKTDADICTYECESCNSVEVSPPPQIVH